MENEAQNTPISETQVTPQEAVPETPNKKPWLIIGLTALNLLLLGTTGYLAYQNYQLREQITQKQSTPLPEAISPSPQLSSKSIVLKIPIIEYETPGNKLTKVIVTGYEDKIIDIGEEFIISPATLGYLYESSLGDIKLKLIEVNNNSIILDVMADEIYDGSFLPREPIEREEITGTKCLTGRPLATDIHSEYCFTLSTNGVQPSLYYTIEERSTMPHPTN
jgi:hypothetical protein